VDNLSRSRATEEAITGGPAANSQFTAINRGTAFQTMRTTRATSITSCLNLRRNGFKTSAEPLRRSDLDGDSVFSLYAEGPSRAQSGHVPAATSVAWA
jgi:hypothetical protein